MNSYKLYQQFMIPKNLLYKLDKLNISEKDFIVLIKIMSFGKELIEIDLVIKEFELSYEEINILIEKNIINIIDDNGVFISLSMLYERIYQNTKQYFITPEFIDRVTFLISRDLTSVEINVLKNWIDEGHSLDDILGAIEKSVINKVDNFSYFEKVLKNNTKVNNSTSDSIKVERNFDY